MASEIRFKILGLKSFTNDMNDAGKRFRPRLLDNLKLASDIVVGEAKRQFKGSRSSIRLKRSGGEVRARSRKDSLKFVRHKRFKRAGPGTLGVFEGTYRKQISYEVTDASGKSFRSEVGPVGVPYARIHEFGGTIRPKKKKFLRFIGSDGAYVFAKSVTIPARPVIGPALEQSDEQVYRLLGRTFKVIR